MEKIFKRFIQIKEISLDDIEVRLVDGELLLQNVALHKEELSRYLQYFLNVQITKATVDALEVALDAEFNSIEFRGVHLALEPGPEEETVFFDALEESIIEFGPAFTKHNDSRGETRFPPKSSNEAGPVKTDYSSKIDGLFASTIGEFSFKFTEVTIDIFEVMPTPLSIKIPIIEIYRLSGTEKAFLDFPQGIQISFEDEAYKRTLSIAHGNICLEPQHGEDHVLQNCMANFTNFKVCLPSLTDLSLLRQCWSKLRKSSYKAGNSNSIMNFNYQIQIEKSQINCGSISLEIEEIKTPSKKKLQATQIQINSLDAIKQFDQVHLDCLMIEEQNGQFDINISHVGGSLFDLALLQSFSRSLMMGSEAHGSFKHPNWPSSLVIKVEAFSISELGWKNHRYKMDATKVEFVKQARGERLHVESLTLEDCDNFYLSLNKASFYRAPRAMPVSSALSSEKLQSTALPWPYYETYVTLDNCQYIPVLSSPEDYFLLRSKCIEQVALHIHFSADTLKINLTQENDLVEEIRQTLKSNGSAKSSGHTFPFCVTASLKSFLLEKEDGCVFDIDSKSIDVLAFTMDQDNFLLDVRAAPEKVYYKEAGKKHVQAKKVLTAALDPHHRPIILTVLQDAQQRTCSIKIVGYLFGIPFGMPQFIQKLKVDHSKVLNHSEGVFIQFDSCSFETILPVKYQRRMAPHVLLMGQTRIIYNSRDDSNDELSSLLAFCENGQLMMAPGGDLTKMIDGLFSEGHVYWRERNYEPILHYECIPIRIVRPKGDCFVVMLQNENASVDVHLDSIRIIRGLISEYLRLVRELRAIDMGDDEPSGEIDASSILESLEDFRHPPPPPSSIDDNHSNEEEGFLPVEDNNDKEDYTVIDLTSLIEEPFLFTEEATSSPFETAPTLVDKGADDVAQEKNFKIKIQLENCNFSIRLCEGELWSPDRPNHVLSLPNAIAALEVGSSSKSSRGSSILGVSPSGQYSGNPGKSSTASESKWSYAAGIPHSHYIRPPNHVDLKVRGLRGEFYFTNPFPEDLTEGASCTLSSLALTIEDISVLDHVTTSKWRTFLGRYLLSKDKGTTTKRPILHLTMKSAFIPQPGSRLLPEEQLEWTIVVDILPLRMHVDQDTLLFILRFSSVLGQIEPTIDMEEPSPIFFIQKFRLPSDLYVRIDYKPKKIDIGKMAGGHAIEIINFFAFEDAELQLPAIELTGILLSDLPSSILRAWLPYVGNKQITDLAGGIMAVRAARTLSTGVNDLLILPVKQYRRGGRVFKGLKKGLRSFLKESALESIKIGAKLVSGAHQVLEHTEDVIFGEESASSHHHKQVSLSHPASFLEGITNAKDALRHEFKVAKTILAFPMQVYERDSTTGAIKSAIRAVPILALRSLVGASSAAQQTMWGMRHLVETGRTRSVVQKYKRMSTLNNPNHNGNNGEGWLLSGVMEEGFPLEEEEREEGSTSEYHWDSKIQ